MKLSQSEINNLICMIEHTRQDISYGDGGTFWSDYESGINEKDIKKVESAINTIKRIILNNK